MNDATDAGKLRDPSLGEGMSTFDGISSSLLRAVENGALNVPRWNRFANDVTDKLIRHAERRHNATREDAQDAVQDTFQALWKCPSLIHRRPNSRFRFTLVTIVKYRLQNIWAKARREKAKHAAVREQIAAPDADAILKDLKRSFLAYLREDLYQTLVAGNIPDSDISRRNFEIWRKRVYERIPRHVVAAEYGLAETYVSEVIKTVNTFLKDEGETLFKEFGMV